MSKTREGLVKAILANPDDDTPRLVLADWFEEEGDKTNVARAEFIRTQIERSRLDPHDPWQSELQAHEYRLLAAHAKAWCGSHFVFKKARFRRGFIEYVHLHLQHFWHHRRQIFALEPVRDVSLTGWMRADDDLVRRVAACEEWKYVETLRVHHQGPHKAPRSNLVILLESPHLTGLKSLRLPMLSFTADARRRFERALVMARLHELTLPGFDTYPDNPGEWFQEGPPAWANLRSLRVGESYSSREVFADLIAMPFWPNLQSLSFSVPHRHPESRFMRVGWNLPPCLKSLAVGSNSSPITVPDEFFERVARLPLCQLRLQDVPLSSSGVSHLFGPRSALQLEDLSFYGQGLTDADFRVLAESDSLCSLRSFSFNQLGQTDQAALARLLGTSHFRELVSLTLGYPAMGADIVRALAADDRPHLRRLSLYCANVPEEDLRALFASPAVRSLVYLRIEKDHRVPQPLPANVTALLPDLPHLACLHLWSFTRDPAAFDVLAGRESLPWVAVQWNEDDLSEDFKPNNMPPLDEELTDLDQWA